MAGWNDLEQPLPLDIRAVTDKKDDLDRLVLRVMKTEDGKKMMEWLRSSIYEQPVALPIVTVHFNVLAAGKSAHVLVVWG